jgi:Protein of unknown function (DUF4197)
MKKILFFFSILCAVQGVHAQTLKDILNDANTILNGGGGNNNNNNGGKGLGSNLTNNEIVSGLREALKIGTQNASKKLNLTNGFFANQIIKIFLPPEVRTIETSLRQFGFNKQCDRLILSLNRAAEDAAGKAVPIFVNAITSMNIQDGLNILRGGKNAATEFLKASTTVALTAAFRPVIQASLGKVGATKYWTDAFTLYNKLHLGKQQVNTDLTAYVTERALSGLFTTVAEEEANIRSNPAAQVTGLLKKVFGG